ncbi:uncharacterized protein LOC129626912 [Bubalus kerabau]|uniref:uncharacterized protein LOC129626912 n=1 Tax=Bubalus carabanensis TaxID=3119969 RepID=UPI00244E8E2D|nr:uncharacterized protein LOC129626912 [Bubalus carabanensis]
MFKLDLEKAEEPEIKLPTSAGSSKKQDSSRKTSISALLTMPKSLTVCITINCGKLFKRWQYQTTLPDSREICMQVKKQQLEPDIKQQTGGRSQDGGGVGQGEHFLPHKFIKRAFKRRVNSTKQLLNAGRGHQAPRKAAQLFERRSTLHLTIWRLVWEDCIKDLPCLPVWVCVSQWEALAGYQQLMGREARNKILLVQLTLEQPEFELHKSSYK